MHDLTRIKALIDQNHNLSDRYKELDALLDDLHNLREKQEFIPEELNTSICTMLSQIHTDQDAFLSSYESLNFGATPSTVSGCLEELADYQKYILEKSSFVEVLQFILSLDSENASAKAALEQHQTFAAAYDCRNNSVDQCKEDLKKYILLRKAFLEEDPAKRLSSIIELSPMIDFPLVVALNTNTLTSKSTFSESTSAEAAPVVTAYTETAAAETTSTKNTFPDTAEPASVPTAKDALPNTEDDSWIPKFKYEMPDFTVPVKPVSNRPAPDEAPVSHKGIENGLTAELNHVLSRENVAASLAPDVVHTASLPKINPEGNGKVVSDPWGSLGITDPMKLCYSVSDEKLRIFRCEKPKRFSASDFQNELSLKAVNRFQKQSALKDAYKYGATTPAMLAELIKEDAASVEDACNSLVEAGYLKAFQLSGSAYSDFAKLYVLTASGRKIFTNTESAALLNLPAAEKPSTPPFASHANAVLNRQLFLKSKKLMELYLPTRQFNVGSFILETNSFINFFPTTNNQGTYAYVGACGYEVKDFLIFKIELQEMLPSFDTITVVGMTKEHARALAAWIYNSFSAELAGKKLQFYVYEDDTYYTYPHEASFKID